MLIAILKLILSLRRERERETDKLKIPLSLKNVNNSLFEKIFFLFDEFRN